MKEQSLALEKSILSRGGSKHTNEKRDKVIRIRRRLYEELGKLGTAQNDLDDVISELVAFWEKHHRND